MKSPVRCINIGSRMASSIQGITKIILRILKINWHQLAQEFGCRTSNSFLNHLAVPQFENHAWRISTQWPTPKIFEPCLHPLPKSRGAHRADCRIAGHHIHILQLRQQVEGQRPAMVAARRDGSSEGYHVGLASQQMGWFWWKKTKMLGSNELKSWDLNCSKWA